MTVSGREALQVVLQRLADAKKNGASEEQLRSLITQGSLTLLSYKVGPQPMRKWTRAGLLTQYLASEHQLPTHPRAFLCCQSCILCSCSLPLLRSIDAAKTSCMPIRPTRWLPAKSGSLHTEQTPVAPDMITAVPVANNQASSWLLTAGRQPRVERGDGGAARRDGGHQGASGGRRFAPAGVGIACSHCRAWQSSAPAVATSVHGVTCDVSLCCQGQCKHVVAQARLHAF